MFPLRLLAVSGSLIFSCLSYAGEAGKMSEERWSAISGYTIQSLTSSTSYPGSPSFTGKSSGVEPAANIGDSFGRRLRGYLTAPQTGNYRFWIAGDDNCELWLSGSSNPAGRTRIAWIEGLSQCTNPRQWDKYSSQRSSQFYLVQGEKYYFEALQKEAAVADHLSIAWQVPGGAREVIPASAVDSYETDLNDRDCDGLPDQWEQAQGLSSDPASGGHGSNGASGDPDADGFSNRVEWLQQSAPLT